MTRSSSKGMQFYGSSVTVREIFNPFCYSTINHICSYLLIFAHICSSILPSDLTSEYSRVCKVVLLMLVYRKDLKRKTIHLIILIKMLFTHYLRIPGGSFP